MMKSNDIEELILGPEFQRLEKGRDAAFPLSVLPDGDLDGHFVLHFDARASGFVNLLLLDKDGVICLQKDRRCKAGLNRIRLNLERYPSGRYRIDLLTTDHIDTCVLYR